VIRARRSRGIPRRLDDRSSSLYWFQPTTRSMLSSSTPLLRQLVHPLATPYNRPNLYSAIHVLDTERVPHFHARALFTAFQLQFPPFLHHRPLVHSRCGIHTYDTSRTQQSHTHTLDLLCLDMLETLALGNRLDVFFFFFTLDPGAGSWRCLKSLGRFICLFLRSGSFPIFGEGSDKVPNSAAIRAWERRNERILCRGVYLTVFSFVDALFCPSKYLSDMGLV
jgi:hypothetical protein